ncbi:MAG: archease [Thermoleophilia bacterium]|nr:archease [Thermoleophilia bacterium]
MSDTALDWKNKSRDKTYTELEHPADLLLEIWGNSVPELFENALFAFYDQLAELEGFGTGRRLTITGEGQTLAEALRSLLAEALYHFATQGFVASRGKVTVEESGGGRVKAVAELDGEIIDKRRHTLHGEIKAVTYHRLTVEPMSDGSWRATVLFDV